MNSFLLFSYLASLGFSALLFGSASAHVFVKNWKTSSDSKWQDGQKAWQLKNTAYRPAADNIGWVGSSFLTTNKAIVCGASYTPKGQVAPSTGKFFSDASYSAGQTLKVRAGGKVTLALQGDTGQGYPHYHGHIITYLARCGTSAAACQSFDAATASYFKIQEKRDGVVQLRHQYSSEASADVWEIPIPEGIPTGSYILRFEIITWGQSVESEGFQDQYYPSCGQLYVESDYNGPLPNLATVKFPGAYHNGKLNPNGPLPGPPLSSRFRRRSLHNPSQVESAR